LATERGGVAEKGKRGNQKKRVAKGGESGVNAE